MRVGPYIDVTCDECRAQEIRVVLATTVRGGVEAFDASSVDIVMRRRDWRVVDGRDLCEDCAEEAATERNAEGM